jgi:hypothetical protein
MALSVIVTCNSDQLTKWDLKHHKPRGLFDNSNLQAQELRCRAGHLIPRPPALLRKSEKSPSCYESRYTISAALKCRASWNINLEREEPRRLLNRRVSYGPVRGSVNPCQSSNYTKSPRIRGTTGAHSSHINGATAILEMWKARLHKNHPVTDSIKLTRRGVI